MKGMASVELLMQDFFNIFLTFELTNILFFSFSCVLTNCILCDGVEVGASTELKDCLVGAKHNVGSGGKFSGLVHSAFIKITICVLIFVFLFYLGR